MWKKFPKIPKIIKSKRPLYLGYIFTSMQEIKKYSDNLDDLQPTKNTKKINNNQEII